MFWTKVKVSVAAAAAAAALVVVPAVTISVAADQQPGKANGTPQAVAPTANPATQTAKTEASEKVGPAKVDVRVDGATVALSVLKDGGDYFVVCPPCSGQTSCDKLDQDKASSKATFKKGDANYYACCPFCLNEIKKDTAKYAKLFDAALKKTQDKATTKKL